jgi:hypothetical protein
MDVATLIIFSPVAVVLALVLLALVGLTVGWVWYTRRQHVEAVYKAWQREGREIHHRPVWAEYYGSEPHDTLISTQREYGALGIANRQLIFVKLHDASETVSDLDTIHWVGTRRITVKQGKSRVEKTALIVHFEGPRRWHVAMFVPASDAQHSLPRALGELTGLKPQHLGTEREDFGPHRAMRMEQDVYGHWHPAPHPGYPRGRPGDPLPVWVSLRDPLYLAPDRLLYDYRSPIHLSRIRRVDLYEKGGIHRFNPFNEELLRIEYNEGGQQRVVGFLVRWGRAWAKTLHHRTNVPMQIHEGRKKKKER